MRGPLAVLDMNSLFPMCLRLRLC